MPRCSRWAHVLGRLRSSSPSHGHPQARPDASGARAPLLAAGSHPNGRIGRPRPPFPYVANVCFKHFKSFIGILHLFYIDVAKVDRGCCTCCKCFRGMLQAFVQNVSSVPDIRCKRFDLGVCICFTHVATCPYVLSVSDICCKCSIWMLHML